MSSQANSMSEPVVANTPARIESSMPYRILIVVGLAVGDVLGLGGGFLPAGPPQNVALALSSLGIIMGSALFAAWFARRGHSIVAVGFALLALAESISLSGLFLLASSPTFPGAYTFAAGVALYAVALSLAAIPFAAHALLWLLGRSPAPSGPLASIGYVLLTVATVGWMITVLRAAPSSQR